MEYEIYILCNLLGIIILAVILLFHFVEAEEGIKENYLFDDNTNTNKNNKTEEKTVGSN